MNAFSKIIGYEGAKNELYQIIDMFKNHKKYEDMGAKLPRGLAIFGEPGTGKTTLVEALIEECDANSFTIKNNKNPDDLIKEINDVFKKAYEMDNTIVFLDDLDKFSEENQNVDSRVFVTVQANIDSVKDKNVLVICTINNMRKLPASLTRSGRFDRKILLSRPSDEDSSKIIEYYLKTKKISKDLNFEDVCKMISYSSCAKLETILNESAILAAYNGKDAIDINDIVKAYVKDFYNVPDDDYECTEEEVEKTALHEAGHAVVAEVLKEGSVGFVTIQTMRKDDMSGFTHMCKEFKRRPELALVGLGGKVAVEQFYEGRCASGCQSDLSKVYQILESGIACSGSDGLGFLSINCEYTDPKVDTVIKADMEKHMFTVKDILLKNKEFLFKVAKELKEKKSLVYSDIKRIRDSVTVTPHILY